MYIRIKCRSNHSQKFYKLPLPTHFAKITGKYQRLSLFHAKLHAKTCNITKIRAPSQIFSCNLSWLFSELPFQAIVQMPVSVNIIKVIHQQDAYNIKSSYMKSHCTKNEEILNEKPQMKNFCAVFVEIIVSPVDPRVKKHVYRNRFDLNHGLKIIF